MHAERTVNTFKAVKCNKCHKWSFHAKNPQRPTKAYAIGAPFGWISRGERKAFASGRRRQRCHLKTCTSPRHRLPNTWWWRLWRRKPKSWILPYAVEHCWIRRFNKAAIWLMGPESLNGNRIALSKRYPAKAAWLLVEPWRMPVLRHEAPGLTTTIITTYSTQASTWRLGTEAPTLYWDCSKARARTELHQLRLSAMWI